MWSRGQSDESTIFVERYSGLLLCIETVGFFVWNCPDFTISPEVIVYLYNSSGIKSSIVNDLDEKKWVQTDLLSSVVIKILDVGSIFSDRMKTFVFVNPGSI